MSRSAADWGTSDDILIFFDSKKGVLRGSARVGSLFSPAWSIYEQVLRAGLDLWVDAGLHDADEARELAAFEVDGRTITGIVAGLESLADPDSVAPAVPSLPERPGAHSFLRLLTTPLAD